MLLDFKLLYNSLTASLFVFVISGNEQDDCVRRAIQRTHCLKDSFFRANSSVALLEAENKALDAANKRLEEKLRHRNATLDTLMKDNASTAEGAISILAGNMQYFCTCRPSYVF